VKNLIVIFLSSLYFLGATEAYQLLKVPNLFEHYKTHQQFEQGLSFSKFIKMHYFQEQTYDNDYQQDMQLPFKSSNRTVSLLNFVTLFAPKISLASAIIFPDAKAYLHFNDEKHLSMNHGNIFQPPRFS
jgi:hypothetical protein